MHLISIYPNYVDAILAGKKTFECRKSALGLVKGDLLQLYATAPIKAILGQARVADVHRGTPEELWGQFQYRTGVEESDFFDYYRDKKEAVLLALADVRRHARPISLARLRLVDARFSPPQTARRLPSALQDLCC